MTMVFATKPAPTPIKPGSFQEYQIANQRMITAIQESTKYIQSDNDKEKVKARIEGLDKLIKDHKEFLREKAVKVKNSAQQFDEVATQYQTLKATYEVKRDVMANDESLTAILVDAGKKRQSLLKSVKSIVKGKATKHTWSPHVEHYQSDPKAEFGDAMDTLAKAGQDLTKLEQEMRSHHEDPKRLTAAIQEYQDLILKTDDVVAQTSPLIAAGQSEWATFVEAIDAEIVDKKEAKANPTDLMKAVTAYKEVRAKIGPQVGAKKKGGCIVM